MMIVWRRMVVSTVSVMVWGGAVVVPPATTTGLGVVCWLGVGAGVGLGAGLGVGEGVGAGAGVGVGGGVGGGVGVDETTTSVLTLCPEPASLFSVPVPV
jgi:hypothetical protein